MKKRNKYLLLVSLFIWIPLLADAQHGTIQESLVVDSSILEEDVQYSIYLPPDYEESNRNYPVLYLLHGFTDDETGWIQFGQTKAIADKHLKSVDVASMIIVMPDAGVSWYVNNYNGEVRYEDFFVEEFIPHIDETYRTRPQKEFRAVAGLSMGGYGTLIMAMKHPDLFAAAAPLSAGVLTREEVTEMEVENWNNVFGPVFGEDLEGEERLTDHYMDNSILQLVENGESESLGSVQYYIDCGDKDFLI
ncbi:MAG: alpha/beta hydrolase-fold protein [Balneolaceae bacterium]